MEPCRLNSLNSADQVAHCVPDAVKIAEGSSKPVPDRGDSVAPDAPSFPSRIPEVSCELLDRVAVVVPSLLVVHLMP